MIIKPKLKALFIKMFSNELPLAMEIPSIWLESGQRRQTVAVHKISIQDKTADIITDEFSIPHLSVGEDEKQELLKDQKKLVGKDYEISQDDTKFNGFHLIMEDQEIKNVLLVPANDDILPMEAQNLVLYL